jgi:hypothetical protein
MDQGAGICEELSQRALVMPVYQAQSFSASLTEKKGGAYTAEIGPSYRAVA